MTTLQAIVKIEQAVSPQTLLGKDPEKEYRRLAKLVHPDVAPATMKERASRAIARLNQLRDQLNHKLPKHACRIGKWTVEEGLIRGDICDLFRAVSSKHPEGILKIARHPGDLDLLEAESAALKKLASSKHEQAGQFKHYFPTLIESFLASGRRANILTPSSGLTLAEIHGAFSGTLGFRHVVWMMNRLLSALGYAHTIGLVHGAVLPPHLLYQTDDHHLVLLDWCYSRKIGEPLSAIPRGYADYYPPEVVRHRPAVPATDIYMAAKCLLPLSLEVPKLFRPVFDWCLASSPASRPQHAWDLQERWRSLAEEEYGPPRFVPLAIPVH